MCDRAPVVDAAEDVAVLIAMVAVDPDETTPNASATIPETVSKRSAYFESDKPSQHVLTVHLRRFSFLPRASVESDDINQHASTITNPNFHPLTVIEISHSLERTPETLTGRLLPTLEKLSLLHTDACHSDWVHDKFEDDDC